MHSLLLIVELIGVLIATLLLALFGPLIFLAILAVPVVLSRALLRLIGLDGRWRR